MGPRQEIRIESINRLHVQSGVRDVQEPQIRRHVLENGHLVALGIPHLLVYTAKMMFRVCRSWKNGPLSSTLNSSGALRT